MLLESGAALVLVRPGSGRAGEALIEVRIQMTANSNFKQRVRSRAAKTGKRYTDARRDVLKILEIMDNSEQTYEQAEASFDRSTAS